MPHKDRFIQHKNTNWYYCREKAKNLLTSREVVACFLFLLFALCPWVQVPYAGLS